MLRNQESRTVAVVGAGTAGLAAARALSRQGLRVRLFDKGRRPGGRISTRREAGYEFDLGSQYITVSDDLFQSMVGEWIEEHAVQQWNARLVLLERGVAVSVAEAVRRYVGVPGMSAIARSLAAGLDVVTATEITAADREGGRWRLSTARGASGGEYDRLVLAAPPPQALPLLTHAPTLAEKVRVIEMQPTWAVMAALEAPLEFPWDAAFVNQSPVCWIARNSSKPGRGAFESWVAHGSSEWSSANLAREPEEVCSDLLDAFFEATGAAPRPTRFRKAHRWRYALVKNPLGLGSLWDPELEIGMAGDWCTDGSVEGAYLSGLDLAARLLDSPVRQPPPATPAS